MANEKNLKSFGERTTSERRELAKKAGIASGKKRAEKANFKKLCEIALNEVYKGEMTNAEAMVISMITKALEGDTKAFEVIRDTAGQKPVQVVEDKISGGLQIVWGEDKE